MVNLPERSKVVNNKSLALEGLISPISGDIGMIYSWIYHFMGG